MTIRGHDLGMESHGEGHDAGHPVGPVAFEFFAGGGLAGMGLAQAGFRIVFANDMDAAKARAFTANHPGTRLHPGDVWDLSVSDLTSASETSSDIGPALCWASSPCQDVSLAGARGGLQARRSGAFWGFWRLIEGLASEGRAPPIVVIENVTGLLSSGAGADFAAVCGAMAEAGYRVGALEIDAALWLPQSRPRLFIVGLKTRQAPEVSGPVLPFHSPRLISAWDRLPDRVKSVWAWWSLTPPPRRKHDLASVLIPDDEADWLDAEATGALIALTSPAHRARLEAALATGERRVAAGFRRVRTENGIKTQRLEVRLDGLAGCLRTPSGGSSRQYVLVVDGGQIRARRLTGREAARLMGLDDTYRLPNSESAALKLMGDAVAVPVVRALAEQIFRPALSGLRSQDHHSGAQGPDPETGRPEGGERRDAT